MFFFLGQDVRLQINCLEAYFETKVFDCEAMEKGIKGLELTEHLVPSCVGVGCFCLHRFLFFFFKWRCVLGFFVVLFGYFITNLCCDLES